MTPPPPLPPPLTPTSVSPAISFFVGDTQICVVNTQRSFAALEVEDKDLALLDHVFWFGTVTASNTQFGRWVELCQDARQGFPLDTCAAFVGLGVAE